MRTLGQEIECKTVTNAKENDAMITDAALFVANTHLYFKEF